MSAIDLRSVRSTIAPYNSFTRLTEESAIDLVQNIQQVAIPTPLHPNPITTAYIRQGSGETPLLLLHGFDSSLLEFCRLFPLLSAEHETWSLDLLGSGFTERRLDLDYTPETIQAHLYSCWKTLINRPVILIGASMGGATAIDFTLTYPEAVSKLILIDSVGYSGSFPIGKYLFPPFDSLAVEFWRQRKIQALWFGSLNGWDARFLEALRCVSLHLDRPFWHEAIAAFTKSGGYYRLGDRIAQINKPTLILWGEKDDMLGTADAKKFHQDIPNSQLVWIENCGHAPQLEQPEITAKQILDFTRAKAL